MAQPVNFSWPQGEDLNIQLMYREGSDVRRALPVPLSVGYSLRMDIIVATSKEIVYTVQGDGSDILGNGQNKFPNINIFLPRALSLPGGVIYTKMQVNVSNFGYDMFLRNTATDRQIKILKGNITMEQSGTLWI